MKSALATEYTQKPDITKGAFVCWKYTVPGGRRERRRVGGRREGRRREEKRGKWKGVRREEERREKGGRGSGMTGVQCGGVV